jgi:hypothetical protein
MKYTVGPDGEILQERSYCPITCSSVTGTGNGGACRCCFPGYEHKCYYFSGDAGCPRELPPLPLPPVPRSCVIRTANHRSIYFNTGKSVINTHVC